MRARTALVFPILGLMLACDSEMDIFSEGTAASRDGLFNASQQPRVDAPTDLVTVSHGGKSIELWPYLTPDGATREDPVNLIFTGAAGAMEIRSALLALDGNRTAFGFPPVYPFNATWSDAIGGVQAGFAEGNGWAGSVIQLQLGNYGPVRFHLRLFQTGQSFGSDGEWTLGGAHFEILIPGTPEHQVISWELAEAIVTADLVRAGLLLAAPAPTAIINDAPSFRTIPPAIYNGIPDALKVACGLPVGPSGSPVPIPTNGRATVVELRDHDLAPGDGADEAFTIQFQQVIPKPFCSNGPADYYVVEGPVELRKEVNLVGGRYAYRSQLSGHLVATPYGGGESFDVRVHDIQNGFLEGRQALVNSSVMRVAPQDGGSELLKQALRVGTEAPARFGATEHCLTP